MRALLEAALEENALLVEERDHQRERTSALAEELQRHQALLRESESRATSMGVTEARQDQAEEALHVAFEELQVLTEELEVANSGLLRTNRELDAQVGARTRQLRDIDQTLRSTEASLRTMADLVPDLLWRADADGQADWFNRRWVDYSGRLPEEDLGLGWLAALHSRDRDVTRAAWAKAVAARTPFERECRICDAQGEYRWFLVRAEPLRDGKGRAVRWFAAATDIHSQRLAMESLERTELRFRTLVEGMPQLVWRAEDGGLWTWCSPQWSEYTGQDEAAARGMGWLRALHPDDREGARDAWKRAKQSGDLEIEARIFHAREKRHRHFRMRARMARDASGQLVEWLGASTDVDDILQLQEEQGLLIAELQHRTRNLLAVVQLVMTRTLASSASLEDFGAQFRERMAALARVHGLLAQRETGARLPFDRLIREELAAHVDLADRGAGQRVTLDGPDGIPLRSSTVQTFALALHELVTNAVKYGALGKTGRLRIGWGLKTADGGEPWLWVDWRETGVADMPPPGAPPRGGGFGRELIERALPYQLGARTTFELTPDGVHCTIELAAPAAQPIRDAVHA